MKDESPHPLLGGTCTDKFSSHFILHPLYLVTSLVNRIEFLDVLVCGGNKSTQAQDIRKAKEYWKNYERRENANK